MAGNRTELLLCQLLVRQEEANTQREKVNKWWEETKKRRDEMFLSMLNKLMGDDTQGHRSSNNCDSDKHINLCTCPHSPTMASLNPSPNLANMPQHRKVAYSEETSVYSQGRLARTHRQVQNCREQYAPPDIHDRLLMIPSPDSSNMSPYQNDTYSEEIDAYRDMTDICREVEQCSDLYAPLNPHIRPPMDSTPYPANMHSYKNVKFLEVAAANAERHQADIYREGKQPIDHYAYPKSHIRPPIAPCQNPANMTPQTNAKCHERAAVNVPRQADIFKKDDQVNDYHEYPQSRVRPSIVPGPMPANMPLHINVNKYTGDIYTYTQGVQLQADTPGKVEQRSNHFDSSNPYVRPPVSSDSNPTNMRYTQNDA